MMVSTVVSLILILGVVEAFRIIGEAVADGRSALTLSGQIRTVSTRLNNDLVAVTSPARSWMQQGAGLGYFEIGEGPVTDSFNYGPDGEPGVAGVDDDGNGVIDDYSDLGWPGADGEPGVAGSDDDGNGRVDDSSELGWPGSDDSDDTFSLYFRSMLGDFDDYVAFTMRSREGEFTGNFFGPIQSNDAEVIWWTELDDANQNGRWDPLPMETFTLRRRILLVRPDVDLPNNYLNLTLAQAIAAKGYLLENFDLSIHIEEYPPNADPKIFRIVANSLADLTQRHNRVGHFQLAVNFPNYAGYYYGADGQWGVAGVDDDGNGIVDDIHELGFPGSDDLNRFPRFSANRFGEDVMISQVLAFDVKVFDPLVPIGFFDGAANDVGDEQSLVPGDPAYSLALLLGPDGQPGQDTVDDDGQNGTDDQGELGWPGSDDNVAGQGAFVDLFYGRIQGMWTKGIRTPFAGPPHFKSRLHRITPYCATYDTWSKHYESDGLNQDMDTEVVNGKTVPLVDEGTDGRHNPLTNPPAGFLQNLAVDDLSERETSPPYPHALRGIQITLRVLDPDRQQVRQITISNDFTPE